MKDKFEPYTTDEKYDIESLAGEATDYADLRNWMYCGSYDPYDEKEFSKQDQEHEVDLIYFYPTVTEKPNDNGVCGINDQMKASAHYAFAETGSAFAPYANVFAPYYTQRPMSMDQMTISLIMGALQPEELAKQSLTDFYKRSLASSRVRTDVYAALDYYFENFNNGRPFILAGHSQGSAVIQIVLSEYMRVHPEYLERMVAAYSIGMAVSKKWLSDNPHLKFATGEKDTGCIISYTTEGPGAVAFSVLTGNDAISINPLNWKLDDTPAEAKENKGKLYQSHVTHSWYIGEGTADAVIDLERGTVICTTNTDYEKHPGLGQNSLHTYDYAEYYVNLRENGKLRSSEFLGHEIK